MATRRKSKALPDLRPPRYTHPEDPDTSGKQWIMPAESRLQAIATKHNFKNTAATAKELRETLLFWRYDLIASKEPTGKERREFMTELVARAVGLHEAITRLGGFEERRVYDAAMNFDDGASLDLDALPRALKLLEQAAASVRDDAKDSRAGRRSDIPMKNFCAKLWRLWLTEFGPAAKKITRNVHGFSGKFFDFVSDVTAVAGIRKSNDALGQAIVVAQAKVKAKANSAPSRTVSHALIEVRDETGVIGTEIARAVPGKPPKKSS